MSCCCDAAGIHGGVRPAASAVFAHRQVVPQAARAGRMSGGLHVEGATAVAAGHRGGVVAIGEWPSGRARPRRMRVAGDGVPGPRTGRGRALQLR